MKFICGVFSHMNKLFYFAFRVLMMEFLTLTFLKVKNNKMEKLLLKMFSLCCLFQGWMNEIAEYNPDDYHINHTHSIYVTLEGVWLRLQRPKTPVPKRAMHDEVISAPHFIHQRHFDLKGSRIFLLPPGLVKKRVWSKKYPICIALAREGTKSKNSSKGSTSNSSTISDPKEEMGFEIVTEEKCDSAILYLFARTGREKEDWYKRFHAATLGKPLPNPILDIRRSLERLCHSRNRTKQQESTESQGTSTAEQSSETVEVSFFFLCNPLIVREIPELCSHLRLLK